VFDYSIASGGLCGFLSFLLSYACAQTVNFIVQRKLVFGSNKKLGLNVLIYIFFVIVLYLICLYVPTLVMYPLTVMVGSLWAANISNALNILIQVVVMYPVLKFIVMKKEKEVITA
jgi:putative flippase GtrA